MSHLSVCYLTSRKEPHSKWFFDSFARQYSEIGGLPDGLKLIMVDFHAPAPIMVEQFAYTDTCGVQGTLTLQRTRVRPKPCVWQGEHRLTKENWFAASNARNTALCLAPDGYIAYVDDLSVLTPGWLLNVKQSMDWNGITLGAYRKVKNLVVKGGLVESFDEEWPGGRDSRWFYGSPNGSVKANGDMLFGCSLVAPVEALLTVGGWPEFCDGLSFEDVIMGQVMENAGFQFRYNRNMMTYESEEHHSIEPAFRRESFEKGPNDSGDKGHAVLNMAKGGMKYVGDNYYAGGTRQLRADVLAGKPFPIMKNPQHEFHTCRLLSEL